jgi:hypothetical protein
VIAGIILGIFVVLLVAALIRALITGTIEFDPGGRGKMSADRSKEPVAFWTIFSIGAVTIAFFVWLLIP